MLALNVPELSTCSGLEIAGVCVPWFIVGLVLGSATLALVRAWGSLADMARELDGSHMHQQAPMVGTPPRISLIRIAPPPTSHSRRW